MATHGKLRLSVIDATLERDVGTADDLVMDPYVVISNSRNASRTRALEDAGKTPTWNEIIELEVANMQDDVLLRVMDENVGANCEIGRCNIKLSAMCVNGGLEAEWTIAFGNQKAGKIHLVGEWVPTGSDPVAVSAAQMPDSQQAV